MRARAVLSIVAVAAVCGAMLLSGIAAGVTKAATTVTIKAQNGDFSGTISSPRPKRCANNRTVKVYHQKGKDQNLKVDTVIGSDISSLNGDHYEWSTGNSGAPNGKYYARAVATANCKADSSPTVKNVRNP
ncbi:MAG TPA: hypothetical protein VK646_00805 [Actinomycetota bacterium]|nr:hypothetical protein [Actinomycetota bacterium]